MKRNFYSMALTIISNNGVIHRLNNTQRLFMKVDLNFLYKPIFTSKIIQERNVLGSRIFIKS